MCSHVLRAGAIFAVACGLSSAADPPRPACTKKNLGQVWPEAAARDPELYARLVRCGQLQICTQGQWRIHWESPTIRLDQLRHGAKLPMPVGCDSAFEAAHVTK